VLQCAEIVALQEQVRHVTVDDSLYDYVLDIVDATRKSDELHVGVSTRGAISLYRAAQAAARIDGRTFVVPDDVKQLAVPVLAHRVLSKGFTHGGGRQEAENLLRRVVDEVPVPT
jgi:MoxR-like ATPase